MTPLAGLQALAAGAPGGEAGLLPGCRVHAYGAEAFGPAAAVALFGRQPCPFSPTPLHAETPGALAALDVDAAGREQAWFADLHDGRVARLWRVGPGRLDPQAETPLALAVDVFLSQARDPVAMRVEDHPELDRAAAPALADVAATLAAGPGAPEPAAQARTFVLRAFSSGDAGFALLSVQGPGSPSRLCVTAFRFTGEQAVHTRTVWDGVDTPGSRASL